MKIILGLRSEWQAGHAEITWQGILGGGERCARAKAEMAFSACGGMAV